MLRATSGAQSQQQYAPFFQKWLVVTHESPFAVAGTARDMIEKFINFRGLLIMRFIFQLIKQTAAICILSSLTNAQAESLDFTFGEGQLFTGILGNSQGTIQSEDFITFALQNDIPLKVDSRGNNSTAFVFTSSLGDIIFDIGDFKVGSVSSNSLGGQDINFINGDIRITNASGNILLDNFLADQLAGGSSALLVQTTNVLSGTFNTETFATLFVNNGAFSEDGVNVVTVEQLIETIEEIAQIETEEEVSENIIKVTSSAVNTHLASTVAAAFFIETSPDIETTPGSIDTDTDSPVSLKPNKLSASADSNYLPDRFWGTHTYSALSEDGNNFGYATDLYQFVGGLDKRWGDFFVGSALSYVYGETKQAGNNSSVHNVGITPYVAYKINSFLFASGLASYNYSSINGTEGRKDADVHNYSAEISLNAFKAIEDFVVKGRGGFRYTHNYTSLEGTIDADYDQLTWIGDIEFGYRIHGKFQLFSGILYEYIDKEATVGTRIGAISGVTHDGVAFYRGGINYTYNDRMKFSLDVSSDLNDEDNDILSFGASVNIIL